MDGQQIYRNACTKASIIAQREQRAFHRGELDWLPCSADTKRAEIIKAFDRLLLSRAKDEGTKDE
jgi:hypothetical protein